MELDVPLDGSHVHKVGSVSKQFTAMAVLLLAKKAKSISMKIFALIYRAYGLRSRDLINAMLGHFSGMADYDFISGGGELKGLNLAQIRCRVLSFR